MFFVFLYILCAQLLQLYPTLCDPMDCTTPGSSVNGDSPGKNSRVGYHFLLQGDLSNPGTEPASLMCPALGGGFFTMSATWEALHLVCCAVLSYGELFATPWTVARQAPLSMGILQARILEWVAMPFSRGCSQPRDRTQVYCITGRFFTI